MPRTRTPNRRATTACATSCTARQAKNATPVTARHRQPLGKRKLGERRTELLGDGPHDESEDGEPRDVDPQWDPREGPGPEAEATHASSLRRVRREPGRTYGSLRRTGPGGEGHVDRPVAAVDAHDLHRDLLAGLQTVKDPCRRRRRWRPSVPSMPTMTSPVPMPAACAGPSFGVSTTYAPCSTVSPSWNARSDVTGSVITPEVGGRRRAGSASALRDRVLHGIDRDREPDVLGVVVARGVDADDLPLHVHERAARSCRG